MERSLVRLSAAYSQLLGMVGEDSVRQKRKETGQFGSIVVRLWGWSALLSERRVLAKSGVRRLRPVVVAFSGGGLGTQYMSKHGVASGSHARLQQRIPQ